MILTFDVETNGLYGEAFAVGYALTTDGGSRILEGIHCCPYHDSEPDKRDTTPLLTEQFLHENVLPTLPEPDCFTTRAVRDRFFDVWHSAFSAAKKQGENLYLMADVAHPCESRFLLQLRADERRVPFTVYPLLDLSSFLMAAGYDPVGTFARRDDELPAHNPLNDARQSSRIFHQLRRGEPIA